MRCNLYRYLKKREWADDCYRTAVNFMFTQMSAKQGIKKFKERAVAAIVKDYKQLHDILTRLVQCVVKTWHPNRNETHCMQSR